MTFVLLQDYEEQTNKLHLFSQRESELKELLSHYRTYPCDNANTLANLATPREAALANGHGNGGGNGHDGMVGIRAHEASSAKSPTLLHHVGGDSSTHRLSSVQNHQSRQSGRKDQVPSQDRPRSRSPGRKMVTAYLSNLGHSRLAALPGVTVREALSKAMSSRRLAPETCAVYNLSNPMKVKTMQSTSLT